MAKKFFVSKIDWDTDGEVIPGLPNETTLELEDLDGLGIDDTDIADELSDRYGFCVNSFYVDDLDEKNNVYNKLLELVESKGGVYLKLQENKRPIVSLYDGRVVLVAAIFGSSDDSSPLRFLDPNFNAWDIYDYLATDEIEHIVKCIENKK